MTVAADIRLTQYASGQGCAGKIPALRSDTEDCIALAVAGRL
jgi:hypothetical protein